MSQPIRRTGTEPARYDPFSEFNRMTQRMARLFEEQWPDFPSLLGRDIFTRILYGGRIALTVALGAIGIALVFGLTLGLLAGYGPRWLDAILILVFDTIRSGRGWTTIPA